MAQGAVTKVKKRKPSVLKRARQSRVRAEFNRANKTRVRSFIKNLKVAIATKNAAGAESLLRPTLSAIDRAISKGVLEENTGNRYKSRLSVAYNNLRSTAKA
jgi:small subunit ribosomal protein S20